MSVIGPWTRKKIYITARTYPTPAKRGAEVSCTAGITEDGEWIRLFPVPYRFIDFDKRFSKHQWIEADVAKDSDFRPESYQINVDTITTGERVGTKNKWQDRKALIYPLIAPSLCHLQRQRDLNHYPTLGFFKPRSIRRLLIRPIDPNWTETDMAKLAQQSMFDVTPAELLEKIPFKFIYQVFCNEEQCKGHHLSCTDWEMGQAFRSWKQRYGENDWEAKFRFRFEDEMINVNDTHLSVGTVSTHPASWIIVSLFYPRI